MLGTCLFFIGLYCTIKYMLFQKCSLYVVEMKLIKTGLMIHCVVVLYFIALTGDNEKSKSFPVFV